MDGKMYSRVWTMDGLFHPLFPTNLYSSFLPVDFVKKFTERKEVCHDFISATMAKQPN